MNKEFKSNNLSVILPVLNEKKNLEYLIPELIQILSINKLLTKFEIIVIDDNSTDGTVDYINEIQKKFQFLVYKKRIYKKSLPKSIYDGILLSSYDLVMWLDADGSMAPNDVERLINFKLRSKYEIVIGSRFVEGGGYKGQEKGKAYFKIIKNFSNSEDSYLATLMSNVFNKALKFFSMSSIHDMTSGFILMEKKCLEETRDIFMSSIYGEYFIGLLKHFDKKKYSIKEIGYICKTRKYGLSKTSNSLFRLFRLSIPYIKAALAFRR